MTAKTPNNYARRNAAITSEKRGCYEVRYEYYSAFMSVIEGRDVWNVANDCFETKLKALNFIRLSDNQNHNTLKN